MPRGQCRAPKVTRSSALVNPGLRDRLRRSERLVWECQVHHQGAEVRALAERVEGRLFAVGVEIALAEPNSPA